MTAARGTRSTVFGTTTPLAGIRSAISGAITGIRSVSATMTGAAGRNSVWGYRLARSYCVLDTIAGFSLQFVHTGLVVWRAVGGGGRPLFGPIYPWWWWRPYVWNSWTLHLFRTGRRSPVTEDYGTDIVVEGDEVYIEGQPVATALPITGPRPCKSGTPGQRRLRPRPGRPKEPRPSGVPLGVWALTQESQGEPSCFTSSPSGRAA